MKYVICSFLFFVSWTASSQREATLSDKNYKKYKEAIQYYFSADIDSALFYAGRIKKSGNPAHQTFANGAMAYIYSVKGQKDKAQQYYAQSTTLLGNLRKGKEKDSLTSYILNYGGLIDWKNKDFAKALGKFVAGKKVSESIGDKMQAMKFSNNIAIINAEVGNYKSAIKIMKQSDVLVSQMQHSFTDDNFRIKKSMIYFNLGKYYEDYYENEKHDPMLLDSALFYFNKTIIYSKNIIKNRINAQMCMGNIYQNRNNFAEAERMYLAVLSLSKENNLTEDYFRTLYNLGDLYYDKKDYMKSLVCFKRVDSLYHSDKVNPAEFLHSNYYQAKIYSAIGNQEEALRHSRIYLDNFEKQEFKLNHETVMVNSKLSSENIKEELDNMEADFRSSSIFKKMVVGASVILVIGLVLLLVVNNHRKKIAERKVISLIAQYKSLDSSITVAEETVRIKKTSGGTMVISPEKEQEILEKLKMLEEKLYYLRPDFTQQAVSRKIRTNTSYLSQVVNKYYNKSFGDYFNELRINWVIKEMINNPVYRKYSTQAIAESAGFKSAVSFTKSFNKRTGVTPVQFIKGLEKNG